MIQSVPGACHPSRADPSFWSARTRTLTPTLILTLTLALALTLTLNLTPNPDQVRARRQHLLLRRGPAAEARPARTGGDQVRGSGEGEGEGEG